MCVGTLCIFCSICKALGTGSGRVSASMITISWASNLSPPHASAPLLGPGIATKASPSRLSLGPSLLFCHSLLDAAWLEPQFLSSKKSKLPSLSSLTPDHFLCLCPPEMIFQQNS